MISRLCNWVSFNRTMVRELSLQNSLALVCRVLLLNALRVERTIAVRLKGNSLLLRTASPDFYVALETLGPEFAMLKGIPFVKRKLFIIDAGGYIGTAALALKKVFPESTVVTIEPFSKNFELLSKNIKNDHGIIAINAALVPENGPKEVYLEGGSTGYWGMSTSNSNSQNSERVETISIEKILREYGTSEIDVLKMDIEGAEFELLCGNTDWLKNTKILMIELHERKKNGIEEAFNIACLDRFSLPLPGEKVLSISSAFVSNESV